MSTTIRDEQGRPVNRTCEECRLRKIRCLQFSDDSYGTGTPCARCSKLGLSCIFLPSKKIGRKGLRKVSETRINNIERKFEALREAVAHGQYPPSESAAPKAAIPSHIAIEHPQNEDESDALDKGLVTPEQAESLYDTFSTFLVPLSPLVACPHGLTWEAVRRTRPAFFRAAIAAAAISVNASLAEVLFSDTERFLIDRVVLKGSKSLDLIQGLLLLSLWHHPPRKFQDFKFNQFIHAAATIVMDLRASQDPRFRIQPQSGGSHSADVIETCRTFLACYLCCSSMALCFRRPNVLRYGSWVTSCLDMLQSTVNLSQGDRQLVAWVRLYRIAEDGSMAIGIDDEIPTTASDVRTRHILRGCVRQVHSWRASVVEEDMTAMMEIDRNMILLSLHEPAMYNSHDQSDFRPPYALHNTTLTATDMSSTATVSISARAQLISSAHNLAYAFTTLSAQQLQAVPVITYAKMVYALTVIAKFTITGAAQASASEEEPQISSLEDVISRLLRNLAEAASQNQQCMIPAIFHLVLLRIRNWYETCQNGHFECGGETIKPLRTLNLDSTGETDADNLSGPNSENLAGMITSARALEPGLPGIFSPSPLLGRNMLEIWGGYYDNSYADPTICGLNAYEEQV